MQSERLKQEIESIKDRLTFDCRLIILKQIELPVYRALYYTYQNNKLKLKELESSRIGKLKRKKVKVPRESILENAVISFRGENI